MTLAVAVALVLLAACDGAFSGFRSSVGRSGLVDHRREDLRGQTRGLAVTGVLVVPAAACAFVDLEAATAAGTAMLVAYAPYGGLALLALAAYGTLGWRRRFLATALILGPLTLLRPFVAVTGGVLGVLATDAPWARAGVVLAVSGVLAVGPVCDRLIRRSADAPR